MDFIQRNKAFFSELRDSQYRPKKGKLLGESRKREFFSSTNYTSSSFDGEELYLGVKVPRPEHYRVRVNAVFDEFRSFYLFCHLAAEEGIGLLTGDIKVPRVYGVLRRGNNLVGTIVEDLSQNQGREVFQISTNQLHKIPELFFKLPHRHGFDDRASKIDLATSTFLVDGEPYVADFDSLKFDAIFEPSYIHSLLEDFSVDIDYPFD